MLTSKIQLSKFKDVNCFIQQFIYQAVAVELCKIEGFYRQKGEGRNSVLFQTIKLPLGNQGGIAGRLLS